VAGAGAQAVGSGRAPVPAAPLPLSARLVSHHPFGCVRVAVAARRSPERRPEARKRVRKARVNADYSQPRRGRDVCRYHGSAACGAEPPPVRRLHYGCSTSTASRARPSRTATRRRASIGRARRRRSRAPPAARSARGPPREQLGRERLGRLADLRDLHLELTLGGLHLPGRNPSWLRRSPMFRVRRPPALEREAS
jgi:hypothetical protein